MVSHRYETRSVTKRRKMVKPFPLLSLPDDLVISILGRACCRNFEHLRRMKRTCKTIADLAESDPFYKSLDLTRMLVPWIDKSEVKEFFNKCSNAGNITAVFLRGMANYFRPGGHAEGLADIKVAAAADLDVAVYSYGMIRKYYSNDGDNTRFGPSHFTRDSASTLRSKLSHLVTWGPPRGLPHWFRPIRDSKELQNRRCCGCMAYDPWLGKPTNIFGREADLCDRCFWEDQTEFFTVKIAHTFTKWPIVEPRGNRPPYSIY